MSKEVAETFEVLSFEGSEQPISAYPKTNESNSAAAGKKFLVVDMVISC